MRKYKFIIYWPALALHWLIYDKDEIKYYNTIQKLFIQHKYIVKATENTVICKEFPR